MFIFRGDSRAFRWSGMLFNGVFTIKLVLFRPFGSSTSSMFILRGNSRTFRQSGMIFPGFYVVIFVMCDV